jgi:hypothetical protein
MRLINVASEHHTYFEEFDEPKVPEYAILSHTWEDGEVSYKEYSKNQMGAPNYPSWEKPGFVKIRRCGDVARKRNINYIWVDTCKHVLYP